MAVVTDGALVLVDTAEAHLGRVCSMEQDEDTSPYILATPMQAHLEQLDDPSVTYKSILRADGAMVGFVVLKLDPDGRSVELARIVVASKGLSYGSRAMSLVERVCRDQLRRSRIWLDVFEFNHRARRLYEKCGYSRFGSTEIDGKPLLLLDKQIPRLDQDR